MSDFFKFLDDSSPESSAPELNIYADDQGELYFTIKNKDGTKSDCVRLCGPGGGSRYSSLAAKLSRTLFEWNERLRMRIKINTPMTFIFAGVLGGVLAVFDIVATKDPLLFFAILIPCIAVNSALWMHVIPNIFLFWDNGQIVWVASKSDRIRKCRECGEYKPSNVTLYREWSTEYQCDDCCRKIMEKDDGELVWHP